MPEIPSPNYGPPIRKQEADPRLENVASLEEYLVESEDDFVFVCYPSHPLLRETYWIIHVWHDGVLVTESKVNRLDMGSNISHNDHTLLLRAVNDLKRRVNPRLDVHPEL